MNVLFIHNNFPGQFGHLARRLSGHRLAAIGAATARGLSGIPLHRYRLGRGSTPGIHPFAIRFEADCLRGEAAAAVARTLAAEGLRPDVIIGHVGWGEPLFVRDIWPDARLVVYAEYYYRGRGADVGFDPEFERPDLASDMRVRAKNAAIAVAVAESDLAVAPTEWQRSCFPETLRSRIVVVHDGIDTANVRPRPGVRFALPGTNRVLSSEDEVVTYVNRHLEPMRGIHVLLRALPTILDARPAAQVVIIGSADGQPYGQPAPGGRAWKDIFLDQIGDRLDRSRVHWLGRVDYPVFLDALAVSRVHVYLTYPFVLSWSLLEAMSAGCLVVASDTAPVREVITHGHNGRLVDFFDLQTLAREVIEALSRPRGEFAVLTAAARQTIIERFDRDRVCLPRLVALIEGLVGR